MYLCSLRFALRSLRLCVEQHLRSEKTPNERPSHRPLRTYDGRRLLRVWQGRREGHLRIHHPTAARAPQLCGGSGHSTSGRLPAQPELHRGGNRLPARPSAVRPGEPRFLRVPARLPIHRRSLRRARRYRALRRRTGAHHTRAHHRSPDSGNLPAEHRHLPDADRLQSRALRYGRRWPARRRVRHAPCAHSRSRYVGRARRLAGRLSRQVRGILDEAGQTGAKIMVSGDLDEYLIRDLAASDAPIDSFGVGTELATSADAPHMGAIYKMVELEICGIKRFTAKFSLDKNSVPGAKQVFRDLARDVPRDVVARSGECGNGEALLRPIILGGRLIEPLPSLAQARDRAAQSIASLPPALRQLEVAEPWPVVQSRELEALIGQTRSNLRV